MRTILSTIVGSRLHGTATPDSDYDYRGVFMNTIEDIISPFRSPKEASWVEGEMDNTSYELRHFCKMCTQGNPSCLEVLVGIPKEITPEGEELRALLPKFISKQRCFDAFMGYGRNQEKKFRDDKEGRKWKYATAQTRTMYQLLHLLKTGELIGTYTGGVTEELRMIKEGRKLESEIMGRIFQLEGYCKEALVNCTLPEVPDIDAIEKFIFSCYHSKVSVGASVPSGTGVPTGTATAHKNEATDSAPTP